MQTYTRELYKLIFYKIRYSSNLLITLAHSYSSSIFIICVTTSYLYLLVQVLSDVDTLLFSLLILKSLTDSKGQIWHCLPLQYYVIEVTYIDLKFKMQHQKILPSTMSLLEVLPTVDCASPLEVLQKCRTQKTGCAFVNFWVLLFYILQTSV